MNNIFLRDEIKIEDFIYEIDGIQFILDSDLAKIYGVQTKRINEAVKNNTIKFPERYSRFLTQKEWNFLRSKFSTLEIKSPGKGNYRKYLPRIFTEQGVAMLATILKSDTAVEMSIKIIDAFVSMRHYLIENKDIYKSLNNINNKIKEHDEKLNYFFSKFDKKEHLFLPGQEYDSYSILESIINTAKQSVIIIDSFADKTLLDLIRNNNLKVILITSNKYKITNTALTNFNKQYKNKLRIIETNNFHDRYFILDNKIIYHIGTSINYIGSKVFNISVLEDEIVKRDLLKYIKEMIKTNTI